MRKDHVRSVFHRSKDTAGWLQASRCLSLFLEVENTHRAAKVNPWIFQTKYIFTILGFIGFTDIRTLVIEPTLSDPEVAKEKRTTAIEKAKEMAKSF